VRYMNTARTYCCATSHLSEVVSGRLLSHGLECLHHTFICTHVLLRTLTRLALLSSCASLHLNSMRRQEKVSSC
jgi:hypothetical protein